LKLTELIEPKEIGCFCEVFSGAGVSGVVNDIEVLIRYLTMRYLYYLFFPFCFRNGVILDCTGRVSSSTFGALFQYRQDTFELGVWRDVH
jgi:hypothetical protein